MAGVVSGQHVCVELTRTCACAVCGATWGAALAADDSVGTAMGDSVISGWKASSDEVGVLVVLLSSAIG
jgi:hypothetical protein